MSLLIVRLDIIALRPDEFAADDPAEIAAKVTGWSVDDAALIEPAFPSTESYDFSTNLLFTPGREICCFDDGTVVCRPGPGNIDLAKDAYELHLPARTPLRRDRPILCLARRRRRGEEGQRDARLPRNRSERAALHPRGQGRPVLAGEG